MHGCPPAEPIAKASRKIRLFPTSDVPAIRRVVTRAAVCDARGRGRKVSHIVTGGYNTVDDLWLGEKLGVLRETSRCVELYKFIFAESEQTAWGRLVNEVVISYGAE